MINWLKGLLYKVQMYDFVSDQFSRCAIDKESLLGDIKDLKAEDKRKYKRIMELTSEVQKYKNQENNDKLFKLEKELIKKYPPAVITYRCRSFPFSKKVISVPINSFITPYDPYMTPSYPCMTPNDPYMTPSDRNTTPNDPYMTHNDPYTTPMTLT